MEIYGDWHPALVGRAPRIGCKDGPPNHSLLNPVPRYPSCAPPHTGSVIALKAYAVPVEDQQRRLSCLVGIDRELAQPSVHPALLRVDQVRAAGGQHDDASTVDKRQSGTVARPSTGSEVTDPLLA